MGEAYRVYDQGRGYFVILTVHQACQAKGMGVDFFSRAAYVEILLANLRYDQTNKGLQIYAWVVMSNHCHFIISVTDGDLSDLIHYFKKLTLKALMQAFGSNVHESRREWLMQLLKKVGKSWFWVSGWMVVTI